jgi:uncharacterized protein (TIGR02231 family)
MKNYRLWICLLLCTGLAQMVRADEPKKVNSKIDKVTVFLQGAQVERSASVSLPAGTTDIIFEGVSPNLNTGSLQAGGKGSFVILSVRYNTEYTAPGVKKENAVPESLLRKIEQTQDSLTVIDFEIEGVNYKLSAWTLEKTMLERNKLITGEGKTDSLALFMQAMEFYRKKIHEINQNIVEVKIEQKSINKRRAEIAARLNEMVNYKYRLEQENVTQASYSYQVVVTVNTKAPTNGTISINYLVNNASWSPAYELRAENSTSPVNLVYKAYITQNTGEDWKDVHLVLSTLNPQRSNLKPTLQPWILRYFQPMNYSNAQMYSNMVQGVAVATDNLRESVNEDEGLTIEKKMKAPMPAAQKASEYVVQNINFSNVEFDIELPYTIKADGKAQQVTVLEDKIPSQFKHYTVPKIEQEAFLMARLTGWEKLNLLPGMANVYFQNTIIGNTQINPNVIQDTMNISLGRDQGISITRKKIKDKEVTKTLSNNTEREIIIEVTVKNKKDEKVEIQVEDQIPITGEEEVKVKFQKEDFAGAEINEQTGAINWNLTLAPRESKTLTFSYIISFPKDKTLQQ